MTLNESLLHQKVASEPAKEDWAEVGAEANNPGSSDIEVCYLFPPTHPLCCVEYFLV